LETREIYRDTGCFNNNPALLASLERITPGRYSRQHEREAPVDKFILRTDSHQREVSFPLDASFPVQAATCRLSTFARGRFDCHWHAALEFERVVEGEMAFQANGTRFTIQRGEGVYLAGNTLHSAWLEHAEDCEIRLCGSIRRS
jgi:quercetin dioxygenase-like cupin family protein